MEVGIRKVALRLVLRAIFHRLGGFAAALLACPLALCLGFSAALAFGIRFRLGLRFSAAHGGLNPSQTLLAARQFGR
jgi:hypothetical protein